MIQNLKNCKNLSSALNEFCIIRHSPVKTLGLFHLKEHPHLQRTVNSLPKDSLRTEIFLQFSICQRRISARDRKIGFHCKRNSSYIKSRDQLYWHFKAKEWCLPLCFVALSHTEYICAQFFEAVSRKGVIMLRFFSILVEMLYNNNYQFMGLY